MVILTEHTTGHKQTSDTRGRERGRESEIIEMGVSGRGETDVGKYGNIENPKNFSRPVSHVAGSAVKQNLQIAHVS